MDLAQLETFVVVARERSITRASTLLHLSQPAVSAQVKALEDALGVTLFERTPRGMSLTREGERLLTRAQETLAARQALLDEAKRLAGRLGGRLRVGVGGGGRHPVVTALLARLAAEHPGVEVEVRHQPSAEVVAGLRGGGLDVGVYNEPAVPDAALTTLPLSTFGIHLVAPRGSGLAPVDWKRLETVPWLYPASSACCGRAAEALFAAHQLRPSHIISVDREEVTRRLVAAGTGVGLLHDDTSAEAQAAGEVELLVETPTRVQVSFAWLTARASDPLVVETTALVRALLTPSR